MRFIVVLAALAVGCDTDVEIVGPEPAVSPSGSSRAPDLAPPVEPAGAEQFVDGDLAAPRASTSDGWPPIRPPIDPPPREAPMDWPFERGVKVAPPVAVAGGRVQGAVLQPESLQEEER